MATTRVAAGGPSDDNRENYAGPVDAFFAPLGAQDRLKRRFKGQIEGIGTHPRLFAKNPEGELLVDETWSAAEVNSVPAALDKVIGFLRPQIGGKLPER